MRKYCVITLRSVFVQGIRALDTLSPYIYYELLVLCQSIATSALRNIKHEAHGRDANKARGKAKYFILHKAQARQCFNYFKEFPEKCFDENVFTGSL